MNSKFIFSLILVLFLGWSVKDDLGFIWMYLHKKEITQKQGVVTGKYKTSGFYNRGADNLHYFIEIQDINGTCKGTSRISKKEFNELSVNDRIPVLAYDTYCLAAFDVHMYAPPLLHFILPGMLLLLTLFYLGSGIREILVSRKNGDTP